MIRIPRCKQCTWLRLLHLPIALTSLLAGTSSAQDASNVSSYDQVSPVLLGRESFRERLAKDKAGRDGLAGRQKALLDSRYDPGFEARPATPDVAREAGASRPCGKAPERPDLGPSGSDAAGRDPREGPLPQGFLPLPHPNHGVGGMVFPQPEIKAIARLERFDLDFDIPDHFLPEFPPALYLTTRPDLGDVSQGKVISVENFQEIFAGILNSKDLEGLRLLVTQFPQQQFNATADRKPRAPRACRASPASTATSTATHPGRPISRATSGPSRIGGVWTTTSLRGLNVQRLFGSQRALKTVEDFTEFEQRGAYFDGDQVSASAKGVNPLERGSQVHFMAEVQELLDFPPSPGLDVFGKLDAVKFAADSPEMRARPSSRGRPDAPHAIPPRITRTTRCTT